MTIYRIRDWDAHFENNKSRERDSCSWCGIPNKQDGLGYGRLLRKENGPAMYGAFVAVVLVASKQKRPRDGHLTDTGRADGTPYTPEDLSIKTQIPTAIIRAMLEAVCDASIGWVDVYENTARQVPVKCPSSASGGKGRGGKGKEEEGKKEEVPVSTCSPLNLLSLEAMIKTIKTARPEFKRLQEPSLANALSACPQEIRSKVVQEFVENTANMLEAPKDPLSLLKGYVRYACRDIKPTGTAPRQPRKQSFDDIVTDIARDLWEHRDDDAGFTRAMKTWRDKTKDIPQQNGMSCLDEALDIVKRKRAALK